MVHLSLILKELLSTDFSTSGVENCLQGCWFSELMNYTGTCAEQVPTSVYSCVEVLGQRGKDLT